MNEPLYTVDQVRELDRQAIEEYGIAGITLMERAGLACFRELRRRWPAAKRLAVLCGCGNNAGDGYVVSRLAHQEGFDVLVVQLGDINKLGGDTRVALEAMLTSGLKLANDQDGIPMADVYVDALLGTGLDRKVYGRVEEAIEQVNARPQPKLSVDIPSGLHADTGQPMDTAIRADCTLTFIGRKRGLYTGHARDYCGDICFDDLQVPLEIYAAATSNLQLIDWDRFNEDLRPRCRTAHKGDFGHVLVVGGDRGFFGAARLAAEAAARVGAGLVSVATHQDHTGQIAINRPELMCYGIRDPLHLKPLLARATVVAIGPGLGQSDWSASMLAEVIDSGLPMVMDADALNMLAREPARNDQRIITPHPGEASRLLNTDIVDIQSDRFAAANSLQHRYGGIVVLKGSGTIITRQDQTQALCSGGNPGMASGGMGDLLTGIIAGLLAQHIALPMAAAMGVCLHARAADDAALISGERGMLASDLFPYIRKLLNQKA